MHNAGHNVTTSTNFGDTLTFGVLGNLVWTSNTVDQESVVKCWGC